MCLQRSLKENPYENLFLSKNIHASIMNTVEELILIVGSTGDIFYTNQRFIDRTGYDFDEIQEKNFNEIYTSPTPLPSFEKLQKMTTGSFTIHEIAFKAIDGEVFSVQAHIGLFQWDAAPVMVLICKDLTDMKILEREFISKDLQLEAILDNIPHIAVIKDTECRFVFVNKSFKEFFNLEEKKILGKTGTELWGDYYLEDILAVEKEVLNTSKRISTEKKLKLKNRELWFEFSASPVFDENKNTVGLTIFAKDITERKRISAQLEAAKEQAEAAALAKSQFLANISHEIRTPLTGILGFLDLLSLGKLDETQREYIREAKFSSEILLNLIQDILDFSKLETENIKLVQRSFPLVDTIEQTLSLFTSTAFLKDLEISSYVDKEIPKYILGDEFRLKQILNNLISNAVKFTEKGFVHVSVKCMKKLQNKITLSFEIQDTGVGISPGNTPRIFDSFSQGDATSSRKYGGNGLGLAISKKLLDIMGGTIEVASEKGRGSTFTFTLEFDSWEPVHTKPQGTLFNGLEILVLSLPSMNTQVLLHYLQDIGCTVYHAASSKTSLEILEEKHKNQGAFDLIFVDKELLERESRSLSSILCCSERKKVVPLFCITHTIEVDHTKLLKGPIFSGLIRKPIRKNELIQSIESILPKPILEDLNGEDSSIQLPPPIKEARYNKPKHKKILVVEDNATIRKIVKKLLRENDLSCTCVENGLQAVELFKVKKFDIILMDCQMPIMDGYRATESIRRMEKNNEQPIIIALTASVLHDDRDKCIQAGMDDYLPKPLDTDLLIEKIRYYLSIHKKPYLIEENSGENPVFRLMEEVGFDQEEAQSILLDYIEETLHTTLKEMDAAIQHKDNALVKKYIHLLKGTSLNMRFSEVYTLCIKIEGTYKQQDLDSSRSFLSQIRNKLIHLQNTLL